MHPSHTDAGAAQQFQAEVLAEIRHLQPHPGAALEPGVFGAYKARITAPDRRERERLQRFGRQERQLWGERTRERVAREQTRPWLEQDRWGLRKRVWQERRDRDRAILELRERALLEWEQELAAQLSRHTHWLQELAELDPQSREWCSAQAQLIAQGEATPELWAALGERRKAASRQRARELLAYPEVRAALNKLPLHGDVYNVARTITLRLLAAPEAEQLAIPRIPILFAALAMYVNVLGTPGSITLKDT